LREFSLIKFALIGVIRVKSFVAERRGKLASYEVTGGGGQNEFVPRWSRRSNAKAEGTMEWM
jgi:hypothetical protein